MIFHGLYSFAIKSLIQTIRRAGIINDNVSRWDLNLGTLRQIPGIVRTAWWIFFFNFLDTLSVSVISWNLPSLPARTAEGPKGAVSAFEECCLFRCIIGQALEHVE